MKKNITNKNSQEDIKISILTPTYNRAKLLQRLYKSITQQSSLPYEWIIVDDGSEDDTMEVVGHFDNSHFPILFIKKSNRGKHTAINAGMNLVRGDYVFIVDSDDTLPKDSLRIISEQIKPIDNREIYAGVAGLCCHHNGTQIGTGLEKLIIDSDSIDIRYYHHVKGDLAEVFRTSVLKLYPFPEYPNEKFCPEQLIWFRISEKYKIRYFNIPVYYADYLEDGLSAHIIKVRMESPRASMLTYQEVLLLDDIPYLQQVKAAINYWRFYACKKGCSAHDVPTISQHWILLKPIGYLMHIIDKWKVKAQK